MNASAPDNANPIIHSTAATSGRRTRKRADSLDLSDDDEWMRFGRELEQGQGYEEDLLDGLEEQIDSEEIFGALPFLLVGLMSDFPPGYSACMGNLIRSISDPEHPLTLEQLAVVSEPQITVKNGKRPSVLVEFTPTIPHCSMATLIGLSLRVRLLRSLPERFKVDIKVREGTHQSEHAVNKQLNDKERVAAALENSHLLSVVQQCLSTADQRGKSN
ncbi:hypothetical protein JCM11251_001654 [Rhodosporidiobolus azoricus]